jgi:hypothetical protein
MSTTAHITEGPITTTGETRAVRASYWGVDRRKEDRPGVPKETPPHPLPGVHWREPPQQVPAHPVLMRADLDRLTPVFGTGEPPRGVSGALRRVAYTVPDHKARHWMLLLLADRVDAIEHGEGLVRLVPAALVVAAAAGAWLALRPRRRSWPWRAVR